MAGTYHILRHLPLSTAFIEPRILQLLTLERCASKLLRIYSFSKIISFIALIVKRFLLFSSNRCKDIYHHEQVFENVKNEKLIRPCKISVGSSRRIGV
nr:MAG: hypothetical protein DIU64_01635 [Caldicoprobacter oshimai]